MAGTENQCIGVTDALGVAPVVKRIQLNQPWRTLSPWLGFECAATFTPALAPPWPDLLLTSGRKAVAAARYIKKASGGRTFTAHIQDPRIHPHAFDLVALPQHDPTRDDNVITTLAAPNRITAQKLSDAGKQFPQFETLKTPRVAVLIGGNSKAHKLTEAAMHRLAEQLRDLAAGLMITTSRRTGEKNEAILRDALKDTGAYIWDGKGENPYFAMLGWADTILVTGDSVSMLSDAGTTGKPVYLIPLEGGGTRLDAFHDNLQKAGVARIFEGRLEHWNYPALVDAAIIAQEIMRRMAARAGL